MKICEDYGSIDRQNNISHESITDEYLLDNVPLVVTDAVQDWKATQEFSIDYVKQVSLYYYVM